MGRRTVSLAMALGLLVATEPAWAWGPAGHRIVARLAEERLTPKAAANLKRNLGEEVTMADVANWADEVREERPGTAPWHYINMTEGAEDLDLHRHCPGGACATVKIREFVGIARLAMRSKEEIREALHFLVHVAGDLHQPLHAGYGEDQGGNRIPVTFYGEESNLHSVWDSGIIERLGGEEAVLARVRARITDQNAKAWAQGNPRTWTWESYGLAVRIVKGAKPENGPRVLGDNYIEEAAPVVEEQLAKAAVRLAELMNQVWP